MPGRNRTALRPTDDSSPPDSFLLHAGPPAVVSRTADSLLFRWPVLWPIVAAGSAGGKRSGELDVVRLAMWLSNGTAKPVRDLPVRSGVLMPTERCEKCMTAASTVKLWCLVRCTLLGCDSAGLKGLCGIP
jgi:hypothetical protein